MKLRNTIKECPKHGQTEHGVYSYGTKKNGEPQLTIRCLECVREQRNSRYADPEKRAHDKAYTKQWEIDNPEKVRANYLRTQEKRRAESKNRQIIYESFIDINEYFINLILKKFKSPLTIGDLKRRGIRLKLNTVKAIEKYIIKHKRASIVISENWKHSTLLKYHYGVRENFQSQPQHLKDEINSKSLKYANEIADKRIKELSHETLRFKDPIPVQ